MKILPFKKKESKPEEKAIELEITRDTNLGEFAATYPKLAEVLQEDYGLHCIGCFASSFDTIETGATIHGYTSEEIDEMIVRLKKLHRNTKTQKHKEHKL